MTKGESGVVGGRYVIEGVIGQGGMAEVYRASDRVLGRAVAVKVLRSESPEPAERDRFAGEARILAGLNHPGLATVLDAGISDDRPYLVMELIEGTPLSRLCAGTPLDPRRVASIGVDMAEALAYAHGAGVIHRDVKPSNVLVETSGRARLTDFGIARLVEDTVRHTATGMTIGTAAYLSPEQVRGVRLGPATDVYSLGLVLLEALTGHPAYAGAPVEVAAARLAGPPVIPPGLAPGWGDLLASMTAMEPAERPAAEDVAGRLRALSGPLPDVEATQPMQTPTRLLSTPTPERPVTGARVAPISGLGHRLAGIASRIRRRSTGRRARRVPLVYPVAGAVVAVVLVIIIAVVLATGSQDGQQPSHPVPNSVPDDLRQPLADLHAAVYGESR